MCLLMHAHLLYWFKLLCKMCSPFFNSFLLCRIRNVSPILELIIRNQDACKMCKNNHIFAEPIYMYSILYRHKRKQKNLPRTSSSGGLLFLEACVPDCRTSEPKPSSSSLNRLAILGSNSECHRSSLCDKQADLQT